MIEGVFWEYFWFPLIVLAVGFINLVMEAWLPLLIIILATLVIWKVGKKLYEPKN